MTIHLPEYETFNDTIKRGSQSWTREQSVRWNGHKLRATIKRDFYDRQSELYVEVWDSSELKWNRIRTLSGLDYSELPSSSKYTTDDEIFRDTELVTLDLLRYAQEVLA